LNICKLRGFSRIEQIFRRHSIFAYQTLLSTASGFSVILPDKICVQKTFQIIPDEVFSESLSSRFKPTNHNSKKPTFAP
jgi:hypothetical protein